ncbi:MAG: hypothetical protein OEZ36_01255 [Spirochaetota bacterium]|nr:hypothetical protein [Spirochaetota bacterium]
MGKIIFVLLFLSAVSVVKGDDEAGSYAYVIASKWGRYYFKMIPAGDGYHDRDKGSGVAYAVKSGQPDKEIWRVHGWYAFETYLSYDGIYLVRLGNWPRGHKPDKKHVGVAFYKSGKLLKMYSTKDLIVNESKVNPSISHYEYLNRAVKPGFVSDSGHQFQVTTVDNVKYVFNIKTGKVVSRR